MESIRQARPAFSILVVEDDKDVCKVLTLAISRKFPEVTTYAAENGKMGVDLFKEHRPEMVITDINMPVMDGIQMAREIKAIKADTRFIVLTAYSNKSYLLKFNEIGCCAYMLKPIEFGKLFDAIENCFVQIRLERQ